MMDARQDSAHVAGANDSAELRVRPAGLVPAGVVVLASLLASLVWREGPRLAAFGDCLQLGLVGAAAVLALLNARCSRGRIRGFWLLIFLGLSMWLVSLVEWSVYELWFRRPAPDVPLGDAFLFVKLVPLTAALALEPDRQHDSHFRAFGLLDVIMLVVYSLYVYAFAVYAYRLIPGESELYSFRFNLAQAIGNHLFTVGVAISLLRASYPWRRLYRIYFCAGALYCLASILSNVALDLHRYYTGSLYDVPLIASMAGFVCLGLTGRTVAWEQAAIEPTSFKDPAFRPTHVSSHLAMLVTLSTPVIGFWMLASRSFDARLSPFRLGITLLTLFVLTLLLSVKQDLLTAGLSRSLENLEENYSNIQRLKSHLIQSEKLTALGELVAAAANRIKASMDAIRQLSSRITVQKEQEPRVQSLAGKIGQYAQRTDTLVENMLHFAQETPLHLAPTAVGPLLESALQLSRVSKLPGLTVTFQQQEQCPPVRADSSQLLHVFLQIISNALDAMEETSGGSLDISLQPDGEYVAIHFADSGPGIKDPERVFEPFYTTKPVGKGTGLGLSTCYGILQQHEGEISCRNRATGGALFTVLVPVAQQSAAVPAIVPAPVSGGAR